MITLGADDSYCDIDDQSGLMSEGELLDGYGNDGGFQGDDDQLPPYDETVAINHGQYIANLLQ